MRKVRKRISKISWVLIQCTVRGNVPILRVFLKGLVEPLKVWSFCWFDGPARQHELVDGLGTLLGRTLQTIVLILNHLQSLRGNI